MIWLPLLKRWAAPLAILAAFGLAYAYHLSAVNAAKRAGYAAARAEMASDLARANELTANVEAEQRTRIQEIDREHQTALADLDARYRNALRPVRLCPDSSRRKVSSPATAASSDTGPAGRDELPGETQADIGPALTKLARAADEQTARLIACQAYVATVSPQ